MKGKRITAIILSGMLLATSVLPVFSTNSKAAEVKELLQSKQTVR